MSNYCSQVGQLPIFNDTTFGGTTGTVDEQMSVTETGETINGEISVSQQGVNVIVASKSASVLFIL
jgi:hypothetical protein